MVGERHAGTNFVSSLVDANFKLLRPPRYPHPNVKQKGNVPGTVGQGCLSHKHTPQAPPNEQLMAETVAIVIVRSVFDWLAGMCKNPWDTNNTAKLPLADCASAPWRFDNLTAAGSFGHYEHLLALRRSKYSGWLAQKWPHMVLVQYECLLAGEGEGSKAFLRWMGQRFGLQPRNQVAPEETRWRLPSRYGLHGYGPYGHGALSVAQLEAEAAPAVLRRALASPGVALSPPPPVLPPPCAGKVCPGPRPPPFYDPLEVVRTVMHHLPAFDDTYRAFEESLGYGELLQQAARLPP